MIALLAAVVLAAGLSGCSSRSSETPSARKPDAFITDRVVTVRIVMKEEYWTACRQNALAEQYLRADFWFDGELVSDVGVRPKGNSSLREAVHLGSPRFSLKIDFNLFNKVRNFRGLKKLNLNNGFSDPTLIRERLAYELFEQMGVPTPRSSFIDLWVNDTHLGVYTMVEQIDKTFLRRHFPTDDGNIYKPEMWAGPLAWTEGQQAGRGITRQDVPDSGLDVNIGGGKLREIIQAFEQQLPGRPLPPGRPPGKQLDYLQLMGLKTNENNPDHSALFRFLDVLNNEPDETFPDKIEKVLDVDEVLRFLAVSTLIVHLDNYIGSGHNYYLYEIDGKFIILPWDLNMAFGTFKCQCPGIDRKDIINLYIDEPTCGRIADRPIVKRLLSHQSYLDAYHRYLKFLLDGPFKVDRMLSRIDELAGLIRPFVESDELKFFSTRDFERGLTEDVGVLRRPTPIGLKTFVVERTESVRQQLDGKLPSSGDGSGLGCFGRNR
jgi:hypothetical protein